MASRGIYVSNQAGTAWVQLGVGPIPGDTTAPTTPTGLAFVSTPSSITLNWNASTDTETGVGGYEVAIDGSSFTAVPAGQLSYTFSGLAASSSHTLQVRARDKAPTPNVSAAASIQATTAAQPVTTPRNLQAVSGSATTTSLTFSWSSPASLPAGATLSRYEWRLNQAGAYTSNGTALTKQVAGLTTNTLYTFGVRAVFSDSSVSAEVTTTARTSSGAVTFVKPMMGTSTTATSTHGGITWDGWRAYNNSALNSDAAKTPKPKYIAYAEGGPNLGGTSVNYTTIFNHVRSVLDTFYYGGTGQTHTARWGIKLYWSNGNENYNKGLFGSGTTNLSQANLAAYVQSMKALYDGCHYIDPTTGQRRYPDAYAGSNPTQFQESSGWVQQGLHAAAQYHDFVMWSTYPPKPAFNTPEATFYWPSFVESQRNTDLGWLTRCFYRTKQAEAQARIDRGEPNYRLAWCMGEGGSARSTSDGTCRPYWAAMAFAGGMIRLGQQYDLDIPFLTWWDDESNAFANDPAGTPAPGTALAWRDFDVYNPNYGGTKPASWASNPKSSWTTQGTVF